MNTYTEVLQSNIESIAKQLNCVMQQGLNIAGMMYVEERPPRIEGPILAPDIFHPTIESSYFTMLHELGHVYHKHTQGRPPYQNEKFYFENGVLKSEAQAWEFALDNSLIEPTQIERDVMVHKCIMSYYNSSKTANGKPHRLWNGNRHWIEFIYDEPDTYFWNVINRMEGKQS